MSDDMQVAMALEDPGAAARALKQIARDERIKGYIEDDRPLHDALLGAARRFIGGERLDECLDVARRILRSGHAVTIDFMGESTRDEQAAIGACAEFHRVLEAIDDLGPQASVSLDLRHIGLAIDPELAYRQATTLAERARALGAELMISMEGSEHTDAILSLHQRLSERFDNVGITLQAYLHRTPADIEDALRRPGKIRLVKGAFDEPEHLALARGHTLDAAYRSLAETLVSSDHPASIATHDPTILGALHEFIERRGLATRHLEFEMLHGVQPDRLLARQHLGYRTRVYLPYGTEWFLYLCHRLAEYPPNIYRAIADAVTFGYTP